MSHVIGIDLGTTYSAIAYLDATGTARIIPDEDGQSTVPSVVFFHEQNGEVTVGQNAKDFAIVEPERVVQFVKREIGSSADRVRISVDGTPHPYQFWGQSLSPEQVTSYLLRHLKAQAETFLGESVKDVVITVPAYFREPERQATILAAELAGFEVQRLINEPTAAGISYGLRADTQPQLALIFDLGGGTFDVTLLKVGPDGVDVVASEGDFSLGGKDWDDALIDFVQECFEDEALLDLDDDPGAISELRDRIEKTKRRLSETNNDRVVVSALGKRSVVDVTRENFESLTENLVLRCMNLVTKLLDSVRMDFSSVDNVVLAGGSTRMPMIREAIEKAWGRPLQVNSVNPDECVALGAAITAGFSALRIPGKVSSLKIPEDTQKQLLSLKLNDVTSQSLGFVTLANNELRSTVVIPKNTTLPCSCSRDDLTTSRLGQDSLDIHVVEGSNKDPYLCSQTNSFRCSGIPSNINEPQLQVTFNYDESCVIEVTAKELKSSTDLCVERIAPADLGSLLEGSATPMDVVLSLDVSGSMSGGPLVEIKGATHRFLDAVNLKTNRVGVVAFGSYAELIAELSCDHSLLGRLVDGITITGSTNMAAGLITAQEALSDPRRSRCIVLMSDGAPDSSSEAISAAARVKASGCLLITVATGSANRSFMRELASSPEYAFDENATITVTETFVNLAREIASGKMLRG